MIPVPRRRSVGWASFVVALTTPLHAQGFDHSYANWDALLKAHVTVQSGGRVTRVKYAALRAKSAPLDDVLSTLSKVSQAEYARFSEKEKIAFLVNAYNAYTVKLIVKHPPVKSIKDIGSVLRSPWKIPFFTLLGQERTLDDVEHGILRKDFKEPRIHFAVNCAAKGCPALRPEAFVASRLDAQLEEATRLFLTLPSENRYDAATGQVLLSSLLKWYGDDFKATAPSVQAFVAKHLDAPENVKAALRKGEAKVSYLDYDWTLNAAD